MNGYDHQLIDTAIVQWVVRGGPPSQTLVDPTVMSAVEAIWALV